MNELERLRSAIIFLKTKNVIRNQDDISDKIGYNKSHLSEILNGKKAISEKFIKIFCATFKINFNYIMNGQTPIVEHGFEDLFFKSESLTSNPTTDKMIQLYDEYIVVLKQTIEKLNKEIANLKSKQKEEEEAKANVK